MSSEPTDQLGDNIVGDMIDSMSTGLFSVVLMNVLFGKNPSFKNVLSMDTLQNGAKVGGSIALYRRVGRPMVNKAMNSAGMDNILKL